MNHSRVVAPRVALVFVTLLFAQAAMAQSDPWQRVQLAQAGRKVEVRNRAGHRMSGTLESWSPGSISLRNRKGVTTFDRNDVASVAMLVGWSRGKKAAVAFGVTAAVVGALVGAGCAKGCDDGVQYVLPAIPGLGGAAAGVAALFPQQREVLYSSELPESNTRPAADVKQLTRHR